MEANRSYKILDVFRIRQLDPRPDSFLNTRILIKPISLALKPFHIPPNFRRFLPFHIRLTFRRTIFNITQIRERKRLPETASVYQTSMVDINSEQLTKNGHARQRYRANNLPIVPKPPLGTDHFLHTRQSHPSLGLYAPQ